MRNIFFPILREAFYACFPFRLSTAGRAEQITTRIAYLVLGVGVSSWAALVPYAKARLGLDEAVLGMLLLCVGVGSLLSMPFTGLISGRFGCRKVILVSGFIFLAMLPLLASVESVWLMALCLFLFGASIGMIGRVP